MVGSDVLAGTYENEIVYTALASSKSLDEVSNNLLVTERFVASGTVETLTFDVTLSTAGLIAPNQIVAYVVPHADAVAGVSTLNTNKTSYSICAGSGTNGVLTSADVDFGETGTTITCTMPAKTPAWDGTTGSATDGLYDIWVSIPDYSANYISKTTGASSARVASVVYAGLQSLEQTGTDSNDQPIYEPYFSEMQDMTGTVCANTNMWGSGTGSDAIIYDYQGEQLEEGVATGTALPGAGADTLGVSSFKLLDNRDSKPYLVRRLADGNCWMVQNLDLNLADFAGTQSLTPANTDISYGLASTDPGYRSSWDPSKSMYDYAKAIDSTVETGQTSYFPVASLSLLGTAQNYQFQPRETSGANYRWGSLLNESGEAIVDDPSDTTKALNPSSGNSTATKNGSVWVENNSRAAFPRSYDNGYDWVDQSAYATAAGYTTGDAVNGGHTSLASEDWSFAHATTYLGDYYNWYAATAESGTWNDTSGNMQDSICPKGWSLPENADTNHRSWNYLLKTTYTVINTAGDQTVTSRNKYGNAYSPSLAMHEIPLSVVFSGDYYWVNGGLGSRGTYGYFWSSTPYATTYARYLAFSSTSVYPQGGNNKTYGFTIRCVAR